MRFKTLLSIGLLIIANANVAMAKVEIPPRTSDVLAHAAFVIDGILTNLEHGRFRPQDKTRVLELFDSALSRAVVALEGRSEMGTPLSEDEAKALGQLILAINRAVYSPEKPHAISYLKIQDVVPDPKNLSNVVPGHRAELIHNLIALSLDHLPTPDESAPLKLHKISSKAYALAVVFPGQGHVTIGRFQLTGFKVEHVVTQAGQIFGERPVDSSPFGAIKTLCENVFARLVE